MCPIEKMTAIERRDLFIRLADDMAAAAMSQTSQSYDQLIESRTQMRALADSWLAEVEGNNQTLRLIRDNFAKIDLQ